MSFFKDDFYSTRVKRNSRSTPGSWPRTSRGSRQGSMFKVALISSMASSVLVAFLFYFAFDHPGSSPSKPASVAAQPIADTYDRIITAAAKVGPAVVSIINQTKDGQLQEQQGGPDASQSASLGSGVIFQKQGGKALVITNAHVVSDAANVQVVLETGEKKQAKILGKDTITDLAVLEVDDKGITTVAELGDSKKLRKGEKVIAIGNPLGFNDSLTDGIVSNLKQTVPVSLNQDGIYDWEEEVIQISAPINPGNSGGALANLDGQVVGINSMKVADTGVEGIGFAIPIDDAMPIVEQLLKNGKVLRPYLGVYSMDLDSYLDNHILSDDNGSDAGAGDGSGDDSGDVPPDESQDQPEPPLKVPDGVKQGVVVLEAVGPAKDAGLKFNDLIVQLDGHGIGSTLDLRKYLYNQKKIGESLTVTYYRDGKKGELTVKLVEKTEE
ncbi:S1C family serine protease [Cohnella nanjingensis]|uniref:Serine protease n=1 Tax=Cohnella nanjingensis TaxID=1387779 RepID=A0A7X0RXV1_9BACL|nr:S1C family serine protease [Cohnella nanjingensis]MBB6674355.1 serine protease [Cohnella nanjingensis]